MAKWIFPRTHSHIQRLLIVTLAFWLTTAGLFSTVKPVQAATLVITPTGSSLPAVVGTFWSQTYTASGGTAPYTCSMSGSIPGMSFEPSTCTLSGTPEDYGVTTVTIDFVDDESPRNRGSLAVDFAVVANTKITSSLRSTHPDGTDHYVAGFPVWVHAVVDFDPAISGKKPSGTIQVSSGSGGPTCSATLNASGEGECALIFSTAGSKTIQVDYPGDTEINPSTASTTINVETLHVPPTLEAGRNHTCYLAADGTMSCWGLSDAFPVDVNNQPVSQGYFSKISSGGYQTCGLKVDGTIACWGDNTDVTQNIPTGQYLDISSGDEHVCAIDLNQNLHCWGNLSSALNAVPTDKVLSVNAGVTYDCAILKSNQRPVCWGSNTSAPTVTIKSLAVGNTHTCAIKLDGSLICWGTPAMSVPSGSNYTSIDSGSDYSCAQKSDGKIACWGTGKPNVDANTAFVGFSSGFLHTCALKSAGSTHTLSCWGDNTYDKAPRISLSPSSLPQYLVKNQSFSQVFTPLGGTSPYTISVASGSLPAGLALSGDTISGTLTTPNSYTFSLSAEEYFSGSGLPLELTPGLQSYSTTVIDGTTTASLSLPAQVDAGSPATARVTVNKIPSAPSVTGSVLVSSADGDAYCRADVQSDGVAECTLYFSKAGMKLVKAEYSGDAYYQASVSPNVSILVNPVVLDPAIGAGDQFSCSSDSNGQITCWGENDSGQSTPPTSGVYRQLDLGMSHACALGLNRRISCWGWNGYNIATPPAETAVKKVTTGNTHTCLLRDSGSVYCWGNNSSNQTTVNNSFSYTDVDAGANHTCAITTAGDVKCWGANTNGQISVPSDLLTRGKAVKISAGGTFTCVVHEDGSLECWGGTAVLESIRTEPTGVFAEVSSGQNFACGRKSDGSITCWGGLTSAPSNLFSQIAAGFDHVCGILTDGRMQCWGGNDRGQAPVISIAPDSLPTIDADAAWTGQVTASGGRLNNYSYSVSTGALPDGLNLNTTSGEISGTPIKAGTYPFTIYAQETNFTPALSGAAPYTLTVRGWVDAKIDAAQPAAVMVGRPVQVNFSVHPRSGNDMGAEPGGVVTISAEGNQCKVALAGGVGTCAMLFATPGSKAVTITYPGDGLYQPDDNQENSFTIEVVPFSQEPQLRTGVDHTYIYKTDGTVGCIGTGCASDPFTGIFTRLGIGDNYACGLRPDGTVLCKAYHSAAPLAFENGPYIDLSVGDSHACALRIDGTAQCQGDATGGKTTPTAGIYTSLSVGGGHTCALKESGEVVCWGQISPPPTGAFTELTSGTAHSCGLRTDGSAVCWGDNTLGQSTVPDSPTAFTHIAAGGSQTCGLDGQGAVTCWGDGMYGQTEPGYGRFIAAATYDDHVCALREGLKLTCWGDDDAGEAPQYAFDPLTVTQIPALSYFEHAFNISGGVKPLTGEVVGSLPPGLDISTDGTTSSGIKINELSPAGMILYGTPNVPGIYPFVLRWTDVSPYPLVMEQPYTLTVTGGDLALDLAPFSTADALEGLEYRFKAVVSVQTVLPVPDTILSITLPEGMTYVNADHPGCALNGSILTCALGSIDPAQPKTVWVTTQITAKSGQTLAVSGSVMTTNADYPEMAPANNADSFTTDVGLRAVVINENFDQAPFTGFTGGSAATAPNGQTLLRGSGNDTIRIDLTGLPVHKNIIVRFDLYVVGGWLGNNPGGDPSEWKFGMEGISPLLDTSFCNNPACRQAFPGILPGGDFSGRSGATGVNELGYQDGGIPIPDSRYALKYKFPHTSEELHLLFSSLNLPTDASWGLDNVVIEIDSGILQVFLPFILR